MEVTKRALIVEDEPHVRLLMERVLGRAGWSVVSADCIRRAIQHVDSVDLMIIDYYLGKERGPDLIRRARSLDLETPPALLVTGTPEEVPMADWELFVGSLAKPFKVDALVEAAEQVTKDRARSGTRRKASLFDVTVVQEADAKKDEAV